MMEDQVFQVLSQLANKLGTTVEYLWGTLVKQARIEGIIALCIPAVITVAYLAWLTIVWSKTRKPKCADLIHEPAAWEGDNATAAWASIGIIACIWLILVLVRVRLRRSAGCPAECRRVRCIWRETCCTRRHCRLAGLEGVVWLLSLLHL